MSSAEIFYKCFRCNALIPYGKLKISPDLKCPECGCKILMKVRPPIVKKVKAI